MKSKQGLEKVVTKYDYIICGGGAAGLSLAIRLCDVDFADKRILLIEKAVKASNDRTWCFWEEPNGRFDSIQTKAWDKLRFRSENLDKVLKIDPYQYKLIRSQDFYKYCHRIIDEASNIDRLQAEVLDIGDQMVRTDNGEFAAERVFSSILNQEIDKKKYLYAAQHFGGYYLKTDKPFFSDDEATFMDFRLDRGHDCRFGYVLPINDRQALIEIAEFSNRILSKAQYRELLDDYIAEFYGSMAYQVEEFEYGIIPMTTYPFWRNNTDRVVQIGIAGGAAKASTGFAFSLIQKQCDLITEMLRADKFDAQRLAVSLRTQWLDRIFLDVILYQRVPMAQVFSNIFDQVDANSLLRFLNNESSLSDELKVILACPKWPFIKGLTSQVMGKGTPAIG